MRITIDGGIVKTSKIASVNFADKSDSSQSDTAQNSEKESRSK